MSSATLNIAVQVCPSGALTCPGPAITLAFLHLHVEIMLMTGYLGFTTEQNSICQLSNETTNTSGHLPLQQL